MQTTRIQLNSRKPSIDVYKTMPSLELNKRYVVRIEQLTVPSMTEGLILNQELFSVERRCVQDFVHTVDGDIQASADLPGVSGLATIGNSHIFIPQNVKTVSQLCYQINCFFRKLFLKIITSNLFGNGVNNFDLTEEFAQQPNVDWLSIQDTDAGEKARSAIECIYRSDGRIGFKYSSSGQKLFVLRLSDEGMRIFGWKYRYIAVNTNAKFKTYLEDNVVISTLPVPHLDESIICVTANPIFNHGHYRHEIAVVTSLPVQQYVECDQNSASFKRQLASYRYPNESMVTAYRNTIFKVLKESRRNVYVFEHANRTHNEFLLTGTELQNFHIRLMTRNYKWDSSLNEFVIDERIYAISDDSLWTITLKITPLE